MLPGGIDLVQGHPRILHLLKNGSACYTEIQNSSVQSEKHTHTSERWENMTVGHSSARQRLLETARELFYRDGIRAIGVDTIVEQSGVGKATLYRHFPTKDDLIAAYVAEEDRAHQQWFEEIIASERSPKEQLLAWFEACDQRIKEPGFRGCPFLNAMAEIAEADHPAYQCAVQHERALRDRLAQLSRQAGARDPEQLADQLLLVVNGALASASLFGEATPAHQLKTIAAHLIDLQLYTGEHSYE
jgi:AcrR family transcriptional regulator